MLSRLSNLNPIACGVLAGVLALGAYLSYYAVKFGLNHPPSATGDEPEYDTLAWELAHGRGFRVDYANQPFREPYELAARESELYQLMTATRTGKITSRPPVLPYVMSLANRLFSRQYAGIRAVNAACMAAICGMLVTMVCRAAGLWPAAITAFLFVVVDTRTRLYGRAILTEAMAAFEVAVLCWLLFRFAERPTLVRAAGIGIVMGVSLLTRTQFTLWLPGLTLVVIWLAIRRLQESAGTADAAGSHDSTGPIRRAILASGTMAVVALLVAAPWMVRNVLVLGEFMPLGSQGWVQLSAAFGDSAWEHRGLWTNLESEGFFEGIVTPEMTLLEEEVSMAHYSRQQALEWIAANPGKALALVPLKIAQEFRPRTVPEGIILILSIAGGVIAWRDLRARILLAVVLCCCVSIAATWSVEGRFIVPLLFAQHGLIALGLVRVCRR